MGVSFKQMYHELTDLEKKIVMMRLKGKSYKYIIEYSNTHDFNYTSREIRVLIDAVLHREFKEYSENKYDELYRTLAWDEQSFRMVFTQPNIVFLFLDYHNTSKGKIPIPEYLFKSRLENNVLISGVLVPYSPNSFVFWILLLNPLNRRKRGYTADYFVKAAKKENIEASFEEIEEALQTSENAIEIIEGEYLFFDNTKLLSSFKKFCTTVIRKKDMYSIDRIFSENVEFYKDLGVQCPLSLYDVIKKCRNRFDINMKVKVLTFPNVLFGYRSKAEYFQVLSKRYRNKSLDEMVEHLYDKSGVNKSYIRRSFRTINHDKLNKDGIIKNTKILLTDRQLAFISKRLIREYYTVDEFMLIIHKIKKSAPNRIVETEELGKLGYRKEYNYCIRIDIGDIRKHLEKVILSEDFLLLQRENQLDTLISSVVDSMIIEYKLVLISDEEFITSKKLRKIGIYKKDILSFLKQVIRNIGKYQFFTIQQLFDSRKYDLIENTNFDIRFYEELINTSMKFEKIHIDGYVLYCISKDKVTRQDFIRWCFEKLDESINILDAVEWINEKYKITVSQHTVKCLAENSGFHYDDTFERVYKNKQLFLMEVFGNE